MVPHAACNGSYGAISWCCKVLQQSPGPVPAPAGVPTGPPEGALTRAAPVASKGLEVGWRACQHDIVCMLGVLAPQRDGFSDLASFCQAIYDRGPEGSGACAQKGLGIAADVHAVHGPASAATWSAVLAGSQHYFPA